MTDALSQSSRLAGQLPGLLLEAERVAHSFLRGWHGRRRAGTGEAFWQFRPYMPGESVRGIDWKETAKRGEAFVREKEWEAAQTLWLYRDPSESMNFSSSRQLPVKKHYAEVLMLALGMLALDGGEQLGLVGTSLAPQAHAGAIERIYAGLPQQKHLMEDARLITARSHAVIFGDFYAPPESFLPFCERLALRQVRGMLVQVFDPAEESLPYEGRVKFKDMENTAAPAVMIQQVEAIRAEYAEKYAAHRAHIQKTVEGWGWSFLALSTKTPYQDAMTQLYRCMEAR
ncbi:MAG: DUF58 domain-containing protein [Alphaproteobacteria bacterium]|nr:DUF58 domain-containing protein [Alphaproteobacteria bacterium]